MLNIKIRLKKQNLIILKCEAFKFASNAEYDEYERGLASMVYKFLIKNLQVVVFHLCQINNLQMNFINQLLKNLKDAKSIFLKDA